MTSDSIFYYYLKILEEFHYFGSISTHVLLFSLSVHLCGLQVCCLEPKTAIHVVRASKTHKADNSLHLPSMAQVYRFILLVLS